MLNLIKWDTKIRVNGEVFNNSEEAYEKFKDFDGEVKIELNFREGMRRHVREIEFKEGVYYF